MAGCLDESEAAAFIYAIANSIELVYNRALLRQENHDGSLDRESTTTLQDHDPGYQFSPLNFMPCENVSWPNRGQRFHGELFSFAAIAPRDFFCNGLFC